MLGTIVLWVIILFIYFLPTLEAARTKKANTSAIFALNFFLGWSIIGWIVAAVWASTKDKK